jgi:hypothetical protein
MQKYENVSTPHANPLQAKTVFGVTQTLTLWNPLDGYDKEIPAPLEGQGFVGGIVNPCFSSGVVFLFFNDCEFLFLCLENVFF